MPSSGVLMTLSLIHPSPKRTTQDSLSRRSGQRGDFASIVQRAKERAIERTIAIRTPLEGQLAAEEAAGAAGHDGLTVDDLLISTNAEFREGEMLPPDDAEEWLKLLDHHPEQVVGISLFRKGRVGEERLVGQII